MAVSRKKKIKGLARDVQSLLLLIWSLSFASNFKPALALNNVKTWLIFGGIG